MNEFNDIFSTATKELPNEYFQLPVAGQENPIYRERVYCYELYHQLRKLWPQDTDFSLSGEIDKSGHRMIRGNELDNKKPDFLVHKPGIMEHNYLIIEVKPSNAAKEGIKKDLKTLTAFRLKGEYQRAILLIYGGPNADFEKIKATSKEISKDTNDGSIIDLNLIELWHHTDAGAEVYQTHWD